MNELPDEVNAEIMRLTAQGDSRAERQLLISALQMCLDYIEETL